MKTAFIVPAALGLFGLAVRTTYEVLKKQGKLDPRNPVLFAGIFAGMVMMLGSWAFLGPADPLRIAVPAAVEVCGLALLVLGLGLALAGIAKLKGLENIDHLVTTGLYAKFRHPMYTGFILWIAGWIVYCGAAVSAAVGIVAVANILYWRGLEERKLIEAYGETYREYMKRSWF